MLLTTKLASVNLLGSDVANPVAPIVWVLSLPTLIYDRWSDSCSLLVDCGGKVGAVKTWSLVYCPFNAWPSARGAGRARIDGKLSHLLLSSLTFLFHKISAISGRPAPCDLKDYWIYIQGTWKLTYTGSQICVLGFYNRRRHPASAVFNVSHAVKRIAVMIPRCVAFATPIHPFRHGP